jgi:hypothetical protein
LFQNPSSITVNGLTITNRKPEKQTAVILRKALPLLALELWWFFGAILYGSICGFLTGASSTKGTAKAVVVTLVSGGIVATALTFANQIDIAGQFLFGFSFGFIVGLAIGLRYRSEATGKKGLPLPSARLRTPR